jgi:hypothetical protein
MEAEMADLKFHLEGGDVQKAAAELGAALEFEFDTIGRAGLAPAPHVVASEGSPGQAQQGDVETLSMTLGIPNDALADDDLERKIHMLERLRRMIEIAARYREVGTRVDLTTGGERRDLAAMEPEDVFDAARQSQW